MRHFTIFLMAFLFTAGLFVTPAKASEPRLIGQYGNWASYVFTEDGMKVCYMVSQPIKAEGNYTKRGDIFALITHYPAKGTKNVFSYVTGYSYKSGSDAKLSIDNKSFTLFTQDENAWAVDERTDKNIASAIRRGNKMVVKGTSTRGTLTTDTFSLKGSSAAHDAISNECGI